MASGADGEVSTHSNSVFLQPMQISPALAMFCGVSAKMLMSRTDVTRKIAEYIKTNNLQNPENRREILADATLTSLFALTSKDKLNYFNIQRYVKPHFIKDVQTAEAASALAAAASALAAVIVKAETDKKRAVASAALALEAVIVKAEEDKKRAVAAAAAAEKVRAVKALLAPRGAILTLTDMAVGGVSQIFDLRGTDGALMAWGSGSSHGSGNNVKLVLQCSLDENTENFTDTTYHLPISTPQTYATLNERLPAAPFVRFVVRGGAPSYINVKVSYK